MAMRPTRINLQPLCAACTRSSRVVTPRVVPRAGSQAGVVLGRRHQSTSFTPRTDGLDAHHGPRAATTHTCDKLSLSLEGSTVTVGGWLFSHRRAGAALHFATLRDSSGTVQLVIKDATMGERLASLPLESVIQVTGSVQGKRSKSKDAAEVDGVEIEVTDVVLLNPASTKLPFYVSRNETANEELRAQHRSLDLRRPELSKNLKLRSDVSHLIRNYLHSNGFTEVETPVLLNSSPEGAREYLVPTRTSGEPAFYALQQSPQQPKQMLIASGAVDRYYQLARCFRDEDGRKDRQPEFTQVDMEMAFVSGGTGAEPGRGDLWSIGGKEVKDVVEGMVRKIWKDIEGVDLPGSFKVMPYQVAMDIYGSDKPDTRYESYTLPIGYYPTLSDADLDKILLDKSAFTIEWMITRAEDVAELDVAGLTAGNNFVDHVKITRANQYTWTSESPLTKMLGLELSGDGAVSGGGVEPGDIIWLAQRKKIAEGGWTHLGRLRTQIADALVAKGALELPAEPHFLWVTQFPLFTRADEDKDFLAKGRWASSHHPFTAPMFEDLEALKKGDVEGVRGQHYDLVLNGQEIGGGSVRIHDAELQEYVMKDVLKLDENEMSRFAHLLQALRQGAPPHGGIALGFDRLIAILAGAKSIREVIAFPKSVAGVDPVFKSPSASTDEVLKGYGLQAIPKASASS